MGRVLAIRYGLQADRVGVWTSGVSLQHFDPKRHGEAARGRLRQELHLGQRLVVLYHGSLLSERGLSQAIQGLGLARDRVPDLAVVLIGSGNARETLRQEVARLDLADRVRLVDAVPYDEVPAYVAMADAGLIPWPDRMEYRVGSPVKLMEYLAMEKPVLATDIEAHRDVLGAAPYGFYSASNEPADLGGGLAALHAVGRAELARRGEAGRELARSRLTWDEQARALTSFLGSLRSQAPDARRQTPVKAGPAAWPNG
jgi:glycosyltransferase involved in cell wall biosynthesis